MKFFLKTALVFFALTYCAHAKPYFDAKTLSPKSLNAPYEQNSSQWNAEIAQIIELQKNADVNEIEKARQERHVTIESMVLKVDPELTREKNPQLYQLLERVSETTKTVTDSAKIYWHKKRPYQASKDVKALIEPHRGFSYPSGHTCFSFTVAEILAEIFPDKKAEFFNHAQEIANHRILVGMHFPKDIEGGKELASLIIKALQKNSEFQNDLKQAKDEANLNHTKTDIKKQ